MRVARWPGGVGLAVKEEDPDHELVVLLRHCINGTLWERLPPGPLRDDGGLTDTFTLAAWVAVTVKLALWADPPALSTPPLVVTLPVVVDTVTPPLPADNGRYQLPYDSEDAALIAQIGLYVVTVSAALTLWAWAASILAPHNTATIRLRTRGVMSRR